MARPTTLYSCQGCGATAPKWAGKCDACGAWNSLVEERVEKQTGKGAKSTVRSIDLTPLSDAPSAQKVMRLATGMAEFDRVTGGGLVPGSALLIGGDPGIGKSTLLLQLVTKLAAAGRNTAYITGEESADQVRMRAARLGVASVPAGLATATNAADIAKTVRKDTTLDLVVID